MEHELKTWPKPFQQVVNKGKRFEIRRNDRNFQVGDILVLKEFVPCPTCNGSGKVRDIGDRILCGCPKPHGEYTDAELYVYVTHLIQDEWGLPDDLCVMQTEPRDMIG